MQRREFLKSAAFAATGVAVGTASGVEAKKAEVKEPHKPWSGFVRWRAIGGPLANIVVSDGLNCVRTDKDGKFELPYREGARFVTVTVPSGWTTSSFFVSLRHDSPRFKFELDKDPRSGGKGCTFIQLADTEVSSAGPGLDKMADDARQLADKTGAAFVVHTGDICGGPGMRAVMMTINGVTMRRPVHYCIGNHDIVGTDFGELPYEELFGPCWYSFEVGGIHFCVTPMYYGDRPPKYSMDDAADWLKNDLALVPKDMPVILLGHMFCSYSGGKGAGCVFGDKRPVDLRTLCNYKGFVYGHLHDTIVRRVNGITLACSTQPHCGGIDMSPGMTRAVIVDEHGGITAKNLYRGSELWKPTKTDCAWETKLGAPVLYSTPIVRDGRIYLATLDDEGLGTGAIYALDEKTGAIVWKAPTVNSIKNRVLYAAGNIVAADAEGRIVAVDAKTGKEKWRYMLPFHHTVMMAAPALSPDGKTIVFGLVRWLAALDAATGKEKWLVDDKPTDGVPHRLAIDGERVYGESSWDGVYAFDLKSGKQVWRLVDRGGCVYPGCDPLLLDGSLYVFLKNTIREIEPATGKVLREKKLPRPYEFGVASGPMYVTDRLIVIGSTYTGVVAVDRKTFELVWNTKNGKAMLATSSYTGLTGNIGNVSPIRLPDGTLCAPACDGAVHFFSEADGKEKKKIFSGVPYCAGAALIDGGRKIVVADLSGAVRAYAV